jgi:hypothetical protein
MPRAPSSTDDSTTTAAAHPRRRGAGVPDRRDAARPALDLGVDRPRDGDAGPTDERYDLREVIGKRRHGRGLARRRSPDRPRGRDQGRAARPSEDGAALARFLREAKLQGPARSPQHRPGPRSRHPRRRGGVLHHAAGHGRHPVGGAGRPGRRRPRAPAPLHLAQAAGRAGQRLPRGRGRPRPRPGPPRPQAGQHHARRPRRGVRARLGPGQGRRGRRRAVVDAQPRRPASTAR